MTITLPDVRQRDEYDCGAVCVEAVLKFFGRDEMPPTLANAVQGMAPDTLEAVIRYAGLPVVAGNMTLDDLKHFTRTGRPVVCPVSIDGGHWVAVVGVSRGRVYFHDPASGPGHLPASSWRGVWTGSTRFGHAFDRWGVAAG